MNDEKMLIGELSKRAGVTPRTVRYYESLGLLNTQACSGGFQTYGPEALTRLNQIAGFKQLGLSLEETLQVITVCSTAPKDLGSKHAALTVLETHLQNTVQKLDDLERFRKELEGMVVWLRGYIQNSKE